ncbi:30736_t:CDS:2 [Racocetra persica]|uniref:30736_t:CDS:1 n=1 Tax=Racocetra persica TaxID=160502 RepID=A0ACA9RBN3_9GLOM|nr:30736_t:CDS:2 [Racocetra persica]
MLKDSGVLAICIDYRELFNLGKMLDETFGEENRAYAPKSQGKHVSSATEYVLVYAKNKEKVKTGRLERSEKQNKLYKNPDGLAMLASPLVQNPRSTPFKTRSEYEEKDLKDGYSKALVLKGAKDPQKNNPQTDLVVQKANGKGQLATKRYLKDVSGEAGHSQAGVRELNAIVGSSDNKFIGTTGHTVFQLNRTEKTTDGKEHEPLPGSFKYSKLTKQINSQTILEMEREELAETILSTQLGAVPLPNNCYLIAKNQQNEGIYLI